MKKVDYIIVGLGIAGISVCEQLEARGKYFVVYDSGKNTATSVAGGVVNPVVLKRFNPAWKAESFYEKARPFYSVLERKLNVSLVSDIRVRRIFNSAEEQNDWFVAGDSPVLESFLSSEIIQNTNISIIAKHGMGEVLNSFRIDTDLLLKTYREYLERKGCLVSDEFEHSSIVTENGGFELNGYSANRIIFSEGAAVIRNPFFTMDCLIPKKGEYLFIRAPKLKCESILKGPFFMIPLKDDVYQVGATFAHGDFSFETSSEGKQKMLGAIAKMISCDFEVVDQIAGMRPTVKDRRPILGSIENNNMYFLNGLGTRGLLMAPLLSEWLFEHIDTGDPLPKEVEVQRFLN
ncbi:FAD-binding oxidoreductase [Aureitalea sp. L0-47]|uniref:NAD(P)/FAD-dependent oxidoreductase n=1 Tax=Aureitalea sp. L0-47 TaxID=2816962 RepID=UPI0022383940|nr:FAD-dependent oxidoreductase [Aureitalea sp. L0-47]MCW5518741.1 FAD-binding oxidoreductase [Aureitalea sp. L0-47]